MIQVLRLDPCRRRHLLSVLVRSLSFSSAGGPAPPFFSPRTPESLQRRIILTQGIKTPVVPIIEEWRQRGHEVGQMELKTLIRVLRGHRRFIQALEISEWMGKQKEYSASSGDDAVRMDLICKVSGLQNALDYFESIPEDSREMQLYGALLNCYANHMRLAEAEAVMRKMKELGFLMRSLSYNVMLKLYSQMGLYEKLDGLIHEMKEAGIKCDAVTYTIRLNAYAATSSIQEMEKLLETMEADPDSRTFVDWSTYVVMATAYLRVGLPEKTLSMLKKSERTVGSSSRRIAYEVLLTSYASLGNKDEIYRIWGLYKGLGKFYNSSYSSMISSLVKLDDFDGAEEIWKEWDSGKRSFDKRIPGLMVTACAKKGLWEKAEMYFEKLKENGRKPDSSAWDRLAMAYYVARQKDKLAEALKQAILESNSGWRPRFCSFATAIQYLKDEGDAKVAEEILTLVKERCNWSEETYKSLMDDTPRSSIGEKLECS